MDGQFVAGIYRGILLDHCGLERAESERQSFFNSPVDLWAYSHPWS